MLVDKLLYILYWWKCRLYALLPSLSQKMINQTLYLLQTAVIFVCFHSWWFLLVPLPIEITWKNKYKALLWTFMNSRHHFGLLLNSWIYALWKTLLISHTRTFFIYQTASVGCCSTILILQIGKGCQNFGLKYTMRIPIPTKRRIFS